MNGNKLRKLRKEKELTIDELSHKSGFTPSYISQVERNLIEPSLSALEKISNILNVSPYYFLVDDENDVFITRKEERQKLLLKNEILEFLVPINDANKRKVKFGIFEIKINPGTWLNQNYIIIDSDKCVIIKKGTLIININENNELLEAGDSIYISANVPHRLYNPSEEVSEILCITSPSIY